MILDKRPLDGPLPPAQQAVADRFNAHGSAAPATTAPARLSPVRVATEADRDAVEALARLMHAEVGMFPIAADKLRATIDLGIKHKLIGLTGGERPTGVLCLAIESLHYTDDFHLTDKFFFVHPDHRKTPHARSLLEWAKHVGDQVGVPVFVAIFNTKRTEAKARMMERHLTYAGSMFVHGLPARGLAMLEVGEAR